MEWRAKKGRHPCYYEAQQPISTCFAPIDTQAIPEATVQEGEGQAGTDNLSEASSVMQAPELESKAPNTDAEPEALPNAATPEVKPESDDIPDVPTAINEGGQYGDATDDELYRYQTYCEQMSAYRITPRPLADCF